MMQKLVIGSLIVTLFGAIVLGFFDASGDGESVSEVLASPEIDAELVVVSHPI